MGKSFGNRDWGLLNTNGRYTVEENRELCPGVRSSPVVPSVGRCMVEENGELCPGVRSPAVVLSVGGIVPETWLMFLE
jgi:hypothetical protein